MVKNMNERLQQFLAAENISQSQFAETIGVARASISHIIAGRNKPGYEFICSIFDNYPSLNPEWLLLGKGKMYKTAEKAEVRSAVPDASTTAETPIASQITDQAPGSHAAVAAQAHSQVYSPASAPATTVFPPAQAPSQAPAASQPSSVFDQPLEEDLGLFSVGNSSGTATVGIANNAADNTSTPSPEQTAKIETGPASTAAPAGKTVTKIIVFYSDNSFQELKP